MSFSLSVRPSFAVSALRLATFVLALAACGAPPGRGARSGADAEGSARVAVVDLEGVLRRTPKGQEAIASFERVKAQIEERLAGFRTELQQMEQAILEARQRGASQTKLQELVGNYEQATRTAQQAQAAAQQQLVATRAELTGPLLADVARIVRGIGVEQGFDLIADRKGFAWVEPTVDLTERVIALYRAQSAKTGTAPSAPSTGDGVPLPTGASPGLNLGGDSLQLN